MVQSYPMRHDPQSIADRPSTRECGLCAVELSTNAQIREPLVDNLACINCDYNLRGLHRRARCPECGTAVGRSLQGGLLHCADADWLDTMRTGALLLVIFLIVQFVEGIIMTQVRSSLSGGARLSVRLAWITLRSGLTFLWLLSIWKLTTAEPRERIDAPQVSLRNAVRLVSVVPVVLTLLLAYFCLSGQGGFIAATIALWSAEILVACALLAYLRRFARRIPDHALDRLTQRVTWVLGAFLILVLAKTLLFGELMSLTTGGALGPARIVRGLFAIIHLLMLVVCFLSFVWAVEVFVRYQWRFARARHDSLHLEVAPVADDTHMRDEETQAAEN